VVVGIGLFDDFTDIRGTDDSGGDDGGGDESWGVVVFSCGDIMVDVGGGDATVECVVSVCGSGKWECVSSVGFGSEIADIIVAVTSGGSIGGTEGFGD
jgi:hypothetical protein